MAVRFLAGAETGDHSEFPVTSGTLAVDSTASRVTAGAWSYKYDPILSGYDETTSGLNASSGFRRFNLISTVGGASKDVTIAAYYTAALVQIASLHLVTDASGNNFLRLWNDTTAAQVGSDYAVPSGSFYSIELKLVISATVGILELRVGQVVRATGSSLNTGSTNIDRCRIGTINAATGATGFFWIDDYVFSDSAYLGAGYCIARQGISTAPTYNAWTKNGAANAYQCWSQTPYGTGLSCSDAFLNDAQTMKTTSMRNTGVFYNTYGTGNINATDTMNAAKTALIAKGDGVATALSIRRYNTSAATDTAKTITASAAYYDDGIWTAPTTGGTGIGNYEIGAVNTSASGTVTVYAVWLMIDYRYIPNSSGSLYFCGGETGDLSEIQSTVGTLSVDTAHVTGGGYAYKFNVTASSSGRPGPSIWTPGAQSSTYLRFNSYSTVTSTQSERSRIGYIYDGSGSEWLRLDLVVDSSGNNFLRLSRVVPYASGSVLTQVGSDVALTKNAFHTVEVKLTSDPIVGIVELRLDQSVVATGVYNTGTTNLAGCFIGGNIGNLYTVSANISGNIWIDDFYARSDQYPGLGYCIARQGVAGTPTYDSWTKNGLSTAALCLSETPFSATNNVSTTTASTPLQSMLLGSFGSAGSAQEGWGILASTDTINVAKTALIAKSSFSTTKTLQILRRLSAVDTLTTITAIASDAYYDSGIYVPTYTQLTSATTEIGVKNTGTGSGTAQVEDIWLMIDYTPTPRTLAPSGISSTEIFGGDMLKMSLVPNGTTSSEAFGVDKLNRLLLANGITSGEGFGTDKVNFAILLSGVASAESFGINSIVRLIQMIGIASAEAFGIGNITRLIKSLGITSSEAFGLDSLVRDLLAIGIDSQESFGIDSVVRNVKASGVTSTEAFGISSFVRNLLIAGIGSAESFGALLITRIIRAIAIASSEAFGTGKINLEAILSSIASAEVFGQLTALQAQIVRAMAIASVEAFGTLQLARDVSVLGISSEELFGLINISAPRVAKMLGISSAEAFGLAQLWFGAIVDEVRFILLDTYPPSRVSVEPYAVLDVGLSDAEIPIDVEFSNTYDVLDIEINAYPTVVVSFIEVPDMNVVLAGDTITIDFQVTNPYDGTLYDPNPAPVISIIDGFGAERVSRDSNVTRLSQGKYRYEYTTPTDTQAAGLYNARVQCNSPSGKPSGSLKVSAFRVIV